MAPPQNAGPGPREHRVAYAELFDAEVRPHNELFRAAAGVGPDDRVLDIGCGTGQSTRAAARAAVDGRALGVDLSAEMLEHARLLSDREGLRNVSYVQADAQSWSFPPEGFDVCISRFGSMFFTDPNAAFGNIGRALRPGARLVLLVWQDRDRNEWYSEIARSLAGGAPAGPAAAASDAFTLADPAVTSGVLEGAGFVDVSFTDVCEPVYYGPDPATAYRFVLGFRNVRSMIAGMDPVSAGRARERLRATFAEHHRADGVFFGSRTWIITARRPS